MTTNQREKRPDEKFCSDCGAIIKLKAEICPACGVRQIENRETFSNLTTGRNRTVAILLALFIGALGFHKFYLGRKFAGVMYLLFCWTAIPFLLSLFDTVMLLLMSDSEFNQTYGEKR